MVNLWPWKGDHNSPASFEKALSSLSVKINKSQTHLDSLRQKGRRLKALWTLYAIFAYLLCSVILVLVVGWRNWTPVEYTAVSATPLLIYLIRQGINTYYNYRVDTVSKRLEVQQAERAKTIDKLKAATAYNSTHELLEKYGGATPAPKPKQQKAPSNKPKNPRTSSGQFQRTGTGPPPPTANIPRPDRNQISTPKQPSTPDRIPFVEPPSHVMPSPTSPYAERPNVASAEFAPNAFTAPPQYASDNQVNPGGHWYDRVLDLLMGEDETSPKNRVVLICQNCRLVNGQAPPGIKSLTELGKWRCSGCGGWNGEEDEAAKAVQEMKEKIEEAHPGSKSSEERISDGDINLLDEGKGASDEDEDISSEDAVLIEAKPRKGRPKGSKKKA